MKRKNLTTYPQMLEGQKGEGWTVVNGGIEGLVQHTDLAGRVLVVPDGDSILERNQRLKELAGARWTPTTSLPKVAEKEKVDPHCLRCAEDFRLTFNIIKASKTLYREQFSKGVADSEVLQNLVEQIEPDDPKQARVIPLVMAALGRTEGATRFINALKAKIYPESVEGNIKREAIKKLAKLALNVEQKGPEIMARHLRKSFAGFPKSVIYARYLMEAQSRAEGLAQNCREEIRQSKGGAITREFGNLLQKKHKIEDAGISQGFGKMTVKVPPLLMPVKAKNKINRHRVTDEGILPFQLYRLFVDGKVFLDPRKVRGGSVVVDISGSMGLTPEQVYEFVLACPGATIAQYSGSGLEGELVVVAHKGRIAPRDIIGNSHMGNVVDGPALEWLSKLPKPRVWVSDTQVTGIHDGGSGTLRQKCLAFCQSNQIKIVTRFDVKAVTAALHTSHRKLLARVKKEKAYA